MIIWLSLFGLCFLVEILWRRGYFFWLAAIAGFNAFILPHVSWKMTLPLFVFLGGIALIFWHYYTRRPLQCFEQHPEERNARDYLYRTFSLTHAIKEGKGCELIDDSYWHLHCNQDLPSGTQVTVQKTQGIFLHVIPV